MKELKLEEAIFLRYKELVLDVIYEEGRVIFLCDEEQDGYSDAVLDMLSAKQELRDITISYTKYLSAKRWCQDKIYSAKR